MKGYSSDDALVTRTVPSGATWVADVPVRLGDEVLVPISGDTAGQQVPCVLHGEVLLPIVDEETLTEGSYCYWDPTEGGIVAAAATGTFLLGTAGPTSGSYCRVALIGRIPAVQEAGLTSVGPDDLEPIGPGGGVPYVLLFEFDGGVGGASLNYAVAKASVIAQVVVEITTPGAESSTIDIGIGPSGGPSSEAVSIPADVAGTDIYLASWTVTGTLISVDVPASCVGRMVIALVPYEGT